MSKKIKNPRVMLFGYHNDAELILNALLEENKKVVGVVGPSNKSEDQLYGLKEICNNNNIIFLTQKVLKAPDFVSKILSLDPDVIFSVSFTQLIPPQIYNIPRYGCFNLHESLLPKNRGSHPLNWVLINGESETGVTLHHVTEGFDEGDIVFQNNVKIESDETINSLERKTTLEELSLVLKAIEYIERGCELPKEKQKECDATLNPRRNPEDGQIDFVWGGKKIDRFVRALEYPWPGSFFAYQGRKVIIWKGQYMPHLTGEKDIGDMEKKGDECFLVIKDGLFKLESIQFDNFESYDPKSPQDFLEAYDVSV